MEAEVIEFPPPQDININMMPFVIGSKESVPQAYAHYWPLIQKCQDVMDPDEVGKIGYLTIHESLVEKGNSQRRPGLHVETPGNLRTSGCFQEQRYYWGCGIIRADFSTVQGGIFM